MTFNDGGSYDFAQEQPEIATIEKPEPRQWKLLIVDDDPQVHAISTLVLRDFEFEGRTVKLLSAYSGHEGMRLAEANPDLAVMLLDVVMETDQAGLDVVRFVRETLQNKFVRIILRTGQPGEAPERRVVINYDINDYKEKTELTAEKLTTAVVSAIRAYRDIMLVEASRRGLEQVIVSSRELFERKSLSHFCTGILGQINVLMKAPGDALYANVSGFTASNLGKGDLSQFTILAGTGIYSPFVGESVEQLAYPEVIEKISSAISTPEPIIEDGVFAAFFSTSGGTKNVVYTHTRKELTTLEKNLLGVFASNIGVAFDNLQLHQEIADTQIDLIYTLGEIVESRSSELGHHVRRIAEFSKLLGKLIGLSEHDIELLQIAAPLHDLGKIGVPDHILRKTSALSADEETQVREHTLIGHRLLSNSRRPMLKSAAMVALQHHEWWNGAGYPHGLSGADIHIFSRIVGIADVLDALTCNRKHRDAWPSQQAIDYIAARRGTQFDPGLVDLMVAHQEDFFLIMEQYPNHSFTIPTP